MSSLLGSFLGTDQQDTIKTAGTNAANQLAAGYNGAYGDDTSAIQAYQPYTQAGQTAQNDYASLIGENGSGAQNAAESNITSDPMFTGQVALQSNALLRNMNARGESAGGAAALAGARIAPSIYQTYLDRYQQQAGQGLQAAGQQGNAYTQRGNLTYGYGATQAGNTINQGNAMAAAQGIGVNNLLGVAGLGANVAGSVAKAAPQIAAALA